MTHTDKRINNNLTAEGYLAIANEYLQKYYGRQVNGGWTMTGQQFTTQSYPKSWPQIQIYVTIHYKKQTITLTEL